MYQPQVSWNFDLTSTNTLLNSLFHGYLNGQQQLFFYGLYGCFLRVIHGIRGVEIYETCAVMRIFPGLPISHFLYLPLGQR